MTGYWVAGLVIDSSVPLPELTPAQPGDVAAWRFRCTAPQPLVPTRSFPGEGDLADDASWPRIAQEGDGWALRFPDLADFVVDARHGVVECRPTGDIDDGTVRHLFLDHLVPRLASLTGDLVLHASAVATPQGAIAFVGASGSGKSSLAAGFASEGFALLADDFLCLREAPGRFVARPSYPGLRLWPDALARFAGPGASIQPVTNYNDKGRLATAGPGGPSAVAVPLVAVFLLDDAATPDDVAVTVSRASGQFAFLTLLREAFRMGPTPRADQQAEFERIARLVEATDVLRLSFPHDFGDHAQLRAVVVGALSTSC